MYLAFGIRPYISFVVGQLSRYNLDLWIIYMRTAKLVLWYLKRIMSLKLIYRRDTAYFIKLYKPHGIIKYADSNYANSNYADSNYANNLEDWKSIMSYYFFINGAIIIWNSKKQYNISTFITEAKYIRLGHGARKGI